MVQGEGVVRCDVRDLVGWRLLALSVNKENKTAGRYKEMSYDHFSDLTILYLNLDEVMKLQLSGQSNRLSVS